MKLKFLLLVVTLFVAGFAGSLAVAKPPPGKGNGNGNGHAKKGGPEAGGFADESTTDVTTATTSLTTSTGTTTAETSTGKGKKPKKAKNGKVLLCHRTGSGGYVLINVSVHAQPAHMRHGDVLPTAGACPTSTTTSTGTTSTGTTMSTTTTTDSTTTVGTMAVAESALNR
jgi:hypothetical protein